MTDYYMCYVKWLSQPNFEPAGVWEANLPFISKAWKTRGFRNNMFWNVKGDVEAIYLTDMNDHKVITLNQRDMRFMSRQS